jgi:methylenetetrahydrofolate dehydrogenase (NADP+)/methenyltetrahydrofolate cyclohydrolase
MSMMHFSYDDGVKESVVIKKIKELNKDKTVNGIILQLPLPKGYDENKLLNTISPLKDVDGLTDISQGKLLAGDATFIPCTPKGILEIFDHYKIDLEGKNVVVVGRSSLVGKPIMLECINKNATVTMCHSKTKNLLKHTKNSDMIITSVGKANFIKQDMINDDVILIDVGFNYLNGKICGDVSKEVSKYKYLTPVPGGVGQMTVYSVYENLLKAYSLLSI